MPLPSRPGRWPASASTPHFPADADEQYYENEDTSALPAWGAEGAWGAERTDVFPAGEGFATEAFPGGGERTAVFDAGGPGVLPGTDVFPAGARGGAPMRTSVLPQRLTADPGELLPLRPAEPSRQGAPAWNDVPDSGWGHAEAPPAPWQPAPRQQPVRLPRPPQRRRTFALPFGYFLLIVTCGLLAWGSYAFLGSVQVFELVLSETSSLDFKAGGAVICGAILAFITFITSMVAVSRSRPKTAAIALMLGAFFLPLGALGGGLYFGAEALKERTLAQAEEMVGQVDAEQVDALLGELEERGIEVPWREELKEILSGQFLEEFTSDEQ